VTAVYFFFSSIHLQVVEVSTPTKTYHMSIGMFVLILIIGFIVALIIAHITGKIGEAAGSSYWLWFALGFFFNIFGTGAAAVYYMLIRAGHRVGRSSRERRQARSAPQPMAPSSDYSYYQPSYLENPLPQPIAAPVETPDPALAGMNKCSKCGADNPSHQQFCWRCGEILQAPAPAAKLCPSCHKEMPAEAVFCFSCGTSIPMA